MDKVAFDKPYKSVAEQLGLHFQTKYADPPLWAIVDAASFGSVSMLVKELGKSDQNAISTHYGIRGDYFASYIQHATVLRNLCAHQSRLFDFPYTHLRKPPSEYIFPPLRRWTQAGLVLRSDRPLLYQLALLYHLLLPTSYRVLDRDDWKRRLCSYIDTLPDSIASRVKGYIDFPANAIESPLWA